jgi:hypothetical protein
MSAAKASLARLLVLIGVAAGVGVASHHRYVADAAVPARVERSAPTVRQSAPTVQPSASSAPSVQTSPRSIDPGYACDPSTDPSVDAESPLITDATSPGPTQDACGDPGGAAADDRTTMPGG